MTRDLADTVKALRERLAVAMIKAKHDNDPKNSGVLQPSIYNYVDAILPIIEPAIRELIAQERESIKARLCDECKSHL